MTDYVWGVLTPFVAIGVLAVLAGAGYLLAALARHIWGKTNEAFLQKVDLRRNRINPFEKDDRPEYLEAANAIRDALLESPHLRTFSGLGWMLIAVRNRRRPDTD